MKTFITGANGVCGSSLIDLNCEKIFFDKKPRGKKFEKEFFVRGDIENLDLVKKYLTECKVLIHMAGADYYPDFESNSNFSNNDYINENITKLEKLFYLAVEVGIEKIVFASSHRVMGMYEKDFGENLFDKNKKNLISHEYAPRPDSFYAVSKLFGENLGQYLSEKENISFQALRIGSVRSEFENHPYAYAEKGVVQGLWKRGSEEYNFQHNRLRGLWMSRRDFTHLVDSIINIDIQGHNIFYGVSNNSRRWFDISNAIEKVKYKPSDNSEEFIFNS